jgi:hypothetical protein
MDSFSSFQRPFQKKDHSARNSVCDRYALVGEEGFLMSNKNQLRKLHKLGITEFETKEDARRRQADLLERLRRAHVDGARYAGLSHCGPSTCGREHCTDACAFGARRRRLREILAVHRLLKKPGGPVYEVWFAPRAWERPWGGLRSISIPAAKKLNARVLDKLLCPGAVAVGIVKIYSQFQESTWTVEVHELIAGADKVELDRVFAGIAHVKALKPQDVGQAISNVLQRGLDAWKGFSPPKAKRRAEFYKWTLNLPVDARIIRYGCDRHFNKLHKKARIVRPKVRKKRPYPYWLVRHQFGGPKWANVDPHSPTFKPKPKPKPKAVPTVDFDDNDYYTRGV